MKNLNDAERTALFGLVTFPDLNDMDLSQRFSMKYSTFASAKSRVIAKGFVDEYYLPVFPRLGFELLATVYTDFNPAVTVEERVKNTIKHVEVYPEMVFSLGESHRGFSISIAENVTRVMRISLERIKLFAELNLLEIELPTEIMLPFELSNIHRYFNLSPLINLTYSTTGKSGSELSKEFSIPRSDLLFGDSIMQVNPKNERSQEDDLSRVEKELMYYIVKYPQLSAAKLANIAPYSRHTISKVREDMLYRGLLTKQVIPNLNVLGYSILSLFHARIDPSKPIDPSTCNRREILQDETVFLVSRPTELLMLAVYEDYVHYNKGMGAFIQFLKSGNYITKIPTIRNHSLKEAIMIKRFQYHELLRQRFSLNIKDGRDTNIDDHLS
ncbi:MAG: hypothetical protein QCI82_03085 [Candidatus Thermoplasmatota archaeon]|nr:hypothetical protein [Candidatus Thermoplasmatota archaeon]